MWLDNNVLFIAPGGAADADEKIPKMINKVKKNSENKKGFCFYFYCLDVPVSNRETADITVRFTSIDGLVLSTSIHPYTSQQNEFNSRWGYGGGNSIRSLINIGVFEYKKPAILEIESLKGEQSIFGYSEKMGNGKYNNFIQARWYYPGTSGNPNDPEIELNLVYEVTLNHAPSQKGWFDDQTVKETGFTPEKFMSMWEATLKGFKHNR